jgi:hypothetical protein
MPRLVQRLLAVLVAFALIGGPSLHIAQPAQYAASTSMADMPCAGMASMADPSQGTPMAPCKGLTPDCLKQMGCVVDVAVPARLAATDAVFAPSPVAYWSVLSLMAGVSRHPEPLPPRTT